MDTTMTPQTMIDAYSSYIVTRLMLGFRPTLLTFMFRTISGSDESRADAMRQDIEKLFSMVLNAMYRNPRKETLLRMPMAIGCPDWPIYKRERDALPLITQNDGLHFHMLALVPTDTRLGDTRLEDHLDEKQHVYLRSIPNLERIHSRTVTDRPDYVSDYVMKSLKRNTSSLDDVLLLPRTHGEMATNRSLDKSPKVAVEARRRELAAKQ